MDQTEEDKKKLIEHTVNQLAQLPPEQVGQISDFAGYLFHKYQEKALQKEVQYLAAQAKAFDFLKEEPEIYQEDDLKEKF